MWNTDLIHRSDISLYSTILHPSSAMKMIISNIPFVWFMKHNFAWIPVQCSLDPWVPPKFESSSISHDRHTAGTNSTCIISVVHQHEDRHDVYNGVQLKSVYIRMFNTGNPRWYFCPPPLGFCQFSPFSFGIFQKNSYIGIISWCSDFRTTVWSRLDLNLQGEYTNQTGKLSISVPSSKFINDY